MKTLKYFIILIACSLFAQKSIACSIFYYIDSKTGRVYFINNEDYWYKTKPYIQIVPSSKKEFGRIWYGWKKFGQGGVNEKGLVMDGAVTPEQKIPAGYSNPKKGNITDDILASCSTTEEAIQFLEDKSIALHNAHIIFGDRNGKAVIIEWVNGLKKIVKIKNNRLVATNFNLSDSNQTESCWRYDIINKGLDDLDAKNVKDTINFKNVGQVMAKAVQPPQPNASGKVGGTLYTTFIDLTEMKLILVYKLDNSKVHTLDIMGELQNGKKRKIKLY